MRSKNILSIVAFVAAFGLSAAFASLFISQPTNNYLMTSTSNYTPKRYCNLKQHSSFTADAITELVVADNANGWHRGSKMYDIGESYPPSFNSVAFADYAEAVESYVDASSSLTTSDLPRDFNDAWRAHMKAWRNYSNFLNKSADLSKKSSMNAKEFYEADQRYDSEISRTWMKVIEIGANYGVEIH